MEFDVDQEVKDMLTDYEKEELQKVCKHVHDELYYGGYLHKLSGTWVNVEVFDIMEAEDYDEDTEKEWDILELEVEEGESDGSRTRSCKSCHTLSRRILSDKGLTIAEKVRAIKEA